MFLKLIILFIVLPLLEMWLIFQLASATSWGTTFLIVIGTGIVGTSMARHQGFQIWRKIKATMQRGELPGDILLDGLLLLAGGLLLITPGLITDTFGFLLLIPPTRALFRNYLKRMFKKSMDRGTSKFYFYSDKSQDPPFHTREDFIDVEWEEQKDRNHLEPPEP